jgi:hypothetical protein
MENTDLETLRQNLINQSEGEQSIQRQFEKPIRDLDLPTVEFPIIESDNILVELERIRKYLVGLISQLTPIEVLRKEARSDLEELRNEFRFVIHSYEVLILSLCKLWDSFDLYDQSIEKSRVQKTIQEVKFALIVTRLRAKEYI